MLSDVSAGAYAVDFGSLYRLQNNLMLAATLTNLGSKLKFLSEGDSLPLAFHLAAAYKPETHWLLTSEVVIPKTGLNSLHVGGEWRPLELLALRTGFRTDTLKELSPLAGFSAGFGLNLYGQELSYAWLPYGDLGNTHYVSLLLKFGERARSSRNLIQYQHIKKHRTVQGKGDQGNPDYMQLMELLNDSEQHLAKQNQKTSYDSLQDLLQ